MRYISPALTTMNGSGSDSMSQHYSPPPNYPSQYSQPPTQRQSSQPFQNLHSPLSINPSFVQYFQPPQHQQQQQPQHQQSQMQGTLSPHALHSPSSSIMSTIMTPTNFYSQPLAPSSSEIVDPQVRNDRFQASVKPLLLPNSFTGAGAVNSLVTLITEYGSQDVGAQTRLEILTKIRDNAGNYYFRAWSENPTAIDITREWLKAGATAKNDNPLVETIMPLLHVCNSFIVCPGCIYSFPWPDYRSSTSHNRDFEGF